MCGRMKRPESPLGVFQEMWDAWSPVHPLDDTYRGALELDHFCWLICTQMDEIRAHESAGEHARLDNEIVDLISIAMNWLRHRGYGQPHAFANAIAARVRTRYVGNTAAIVARDRERYGRPE